MRARREKAGCGEARSGRGRSEGDHRVTALPGVSQTLQIGPDGSGRRGVHRIAAWGEAGRPSGSFRLRRVQRIRPTEPIFRLMTVLLP
jgi:hypothetical protein